MTRIVVDLPAPFGPRKPVTRPGWGSEGDVVDGGGGYLRVNSTDHGLNLAASRRARISPRAGLSGGRKYGAEGHTRGRWPEPDVPPRAAVTKEAGCTQRV